MRDALTATSEEGFGELCSSYGTFEAEFVGQLYNGVMRMNAKLTGSAKAKAAQEAAAKQASGEVSPGSKGFSHTYQSGEQMKGEGTGKKKDNVRGGLILPKKKKADGADDEVERHVFKKPEPRPSLFGLEALAKKKREEAAADDAKCAQLHTASPPARPSARAVCREAQAAVPATERWPRAGPPP